MTAEGWAVPAAQAAWRTCSLCGARSDDEADVHPAMWPTVAGAWESGARCADRAGCRDRVAAKGLAWRVDEPAPLPPVPAAQAPTDPPDPTSPDDGPLDGDASHDDAGASESWDFDA